MILSYSLFEYSYILNEPIFKDGYYLEDVKNGNLTLKHLWTGQGGDHYYLFKQRDTNLEKLKFGKWEDETLYIDTSEQYLVRVNEKNEVVTRMNWENKDGRLKNIVTDEEENIYIQWEKLDEYDSKIEEEGIKVYTKKGKFIADIFQKSYRGKKFPQVPYGIGFIKALQYNKGKVYFYYQTNEKLGLYQYDHYLEDLWETDIVEEEYKFIDLVGTELGQIYFATNDSKFGVVNENGQVLLLKDFFHEKQVIGSIFKERKVVWIELLSSKGTKTVKYENNQFVTVGKINKGLESGIKGNIDYSKNILQLKYMVLGGFFLILLLIIYLIRFIYIYLFQRKVYIVIKQLMVVIPLILMGMMILILQSVVGGFSEFSDEIQGGEFHKFNQIIDEKFEMIEKRAKDRHYLGNLIDAIELYKDMDGDVYKELYNMTKLTDLNYDGIEGMYWVIDKVENGNVYKVLDSENHFKMFYPRFAKGKNKFFKAAAEGNTVDAIGTNNQYIFTMKPIYNDKEDVVGIFQIGMYYSGYRQKVDMRIFSSIVYRIFAITIMIVGMIICMTYFLLRNLSKLTKTVKEVAAGNLDREVDIRSKDEIEELSESFNLMTANIRKYIESITAINKSYYRFIPKEILSLLDREDVNEINLGDHGKFEMCILNVGIENFYEISGKMSEEESFQFINEYLKIIGPIIRKYGGVIENYFGKGLVGIFPGNSENSVKAAIQIIYKTSKYAMKNSHLPKGDVRIAIHKGTILIGVIGEEQRLQSRMISDSANSTGAIRERASLLSSKILITKEVFDDIGSNHFQYRRIGKVSIANREESMELYDIYEADDLEIKILKMKMKETFEQAVDAFTLGRFYEARSSFVKILDEYTHDYAAREYFYQSDEYYKNEVKKDENTSLILS
jgi:class 3 adenylate cyclase/HAMP domain-containing protein